MSFNDDNYFRETKLILKYEINRIVNVCKIRKCALRLYKGFFLLWDFETYGYMYQFDLIDNADLERGALHILYLGREGACFP